MTQDQVRSWTEYVYSLMDSATSPLYKDGKLISNWGSVWEDYFNSGLDAIDTSAYEEKLKNKIEAAFGNKDGSVSLDGIEIKYNLSDSKIVITDANGLKPDVL